MKINFSCILIMVFVSPYSSLAANIDCLRDNFEKYMNAAENMHKYQLSQLENQPEPVQKAFQEQVGWQLSNLALSKTVFEALIKNNPELIDMNAPIGNLYQAYLSGYASEGCTEEKCNIDSGKLVIKVSKIQAVSNNL